MESTTLKLWEWNVDKPSLTENVMEQSVKHMPSEHPDCYTILSFKVCVNLAFPVSEQVEIF